MSPTPTNPADLLREAADQLRDVAPQITGPLAGLADPVADWLDQAAKHHDATVIGAASVWQRPDEAAYRDAFVTKHTDRAALAVARQVLGTATTDTGAQTDSLRDRIAVAVRTVSIKYGDGTIEPVSADEAAVLTDAVMAVLPAGAVDRATVCICGHTEAQHFEDVCQVCDCGDYLVPEAAREMIAHLRGAALDEQDGRRATTLREGADLIEQALIHSVAPASSERDEVWDQAVRAAATELRNVADGVAVEAQQPTPAETEETTR